MIYYKPLVALILILGILTPQLVLAVPILGDFGSVAKCSLLNGLIRRIFEKIVDKIVGYIEEAIDKLICIVTFGFACGPEKVDIVNDTLEAKEYFKDAISRCIARQILNRMSEGILALTRKMGRDGGPTFVRNWRGFISRAQYRGEDIFRATLAATTLCPHTSSDLRSIFKADGQPVLPSSTRVNNLDPFTRRARCTMPAGWSTTAYTQDFAGNGGWEALARLSQPQNNFYGSFLMSLEELSVQRALEENSDILETQGHGFTSKRGDDRTESCSLVGTNGRCLVYGDIETPADILKELSAEALKSEIHWVVGVDELNELIMNMYDVLVNRLSDLSGSRGKDESDQTLELDPAFDDELPSRTPYPQIPLTPEEICVDVCTKSEGPDALSTCVNACYSRPSDRGGGGGGGGGGVCADSGGVANYSGDLQGAINAVIANNPGGIADAPNNTANSFAFLNLVAGQLQTAGFNATTSVLNGNSNPNSGDLIAIWRPEDNTLERYDAVFAAGDADRPMRNAATSGGFTGDIPLSCTF